MINDLLPFEPNRYTIEVGVNRQKAYKVSTNELHINFHNKTL